MDWETMEAARKFSEEQEAARRKPSPRPFTLLREILERVKEQLEDHRGAKGW